MSEKVTVRSEPRVYHAHGSHSYFRDLAHVEVFRGLPGVSQAQDRLNRHAQEIDAEIRSGSAEGRYAEKVIREVRRSSEAGRELRAGMSTGSSSGGAFVTPQYLTQLWAAFRTADRSFINQCQALPLPPVGVTVNVPSFTSTTATTQQTELQGVAEADPSGAFLTAPVVSQDGQATISLQLLERGGYAGDGGAFDQIMVHQLGNQLDSQVDLYAINQSTANAAAVTDSSAYSTTNLFADLSAAREKLTDTAGTRLYGSHLFTTSDLAGYVTKQVDSQNRPIFLPDAGALMEADGKPEWLGWLGLCLPGHLQWFADDNIPATGSNTQLIVACPKRVFVWEGDPISFTALQANPDAMTMSAVVGLRKYVAVMPQYAKAIAVISGSAYPTTLV